MSTKEKTMVGPSTTATLSINELDILSTLKMRAVQGIYEPNDFYHPFNYEFEPPDGAYLYVVITKCEKYYVGITERPLHQRWREHIGIEVNTGAEFLKDKDITQLVYVTHMHQANAEYIEQHLTLQLAVTHRVDNVTGGVYAEGRDMELDIPRKTPETYDFLSKVDSVNNEPIPLDQAHPDFTPVPLTHTIKNILYWILTGIFWLLVIRGVVEILPS